MNNQEYEYFVMLMLEDYHAYRSINLMKQYLYAKFERRFSNEEIIAANRKFNTSTKLVKNIKE